MLAPHVAHQRLHLIAQRLELAGGEEIIDHDKAVSLEIGTATRFQPLPPSAKGFGEVDPLTM